jgi:hypothetical protein
VVDYAEKNAEKASRERSTDTLWNGAGLPILRAAVEYNREQPSKALDFSIRQIRESLSVRDIHPRIGLPEVASRSRSRGGVSKGRRSQGGELGPLYPLSYLGMARGFALTADAARARKAYNEFLTLWKDAEPDVPILIRAQKEYEGLAR